MHMTLHADMTSLRHYCKAVYKSRCLCAIFHFFFFRCSFYSSAAFIRGRLTCNVLSLQVPWMQSGTVTCTVRAKFCFVNVTNLFQNINKHFWQAKVIEVSSAWAILGHHFQAAASIWVRLMCNLSLVTVRLLFECGFWSSAAFIHDFTVYNITSQQQLQRNLQKVINDMSWTQILAIAPTRRVFRVFSQQFFETDRKMNHFQRLNEVKELKIFFFAQRENTQKKASSRRPLPCDTLAPTVQNCAGAQCSERTRQRCAQQTRQRCTQKTSSYRYIRTFLTFRAHRGSLPKRRELELSSLPPPPPFRRFSAPSL